MNTELESKPNLTLLQWTPRQVRWFENFVSIVAILFFLSGTAIHLQEFWLGRISFGRFAFAELILNLPKACVPVALAQLFRICVIPDSEVPWLLRNASRLLMAYAAITALLYLRLELVQWRWLVHSSPEPTLSKFHKLIVQALLRLLILFACIVAAGAARILVAWHAGWVPTRPQNTVHDL